MAEFKKVLVTDIVFPNVSVYRKYRDGVLCGFEVYADNGYVMYDKKASITELDPKTSEEIPVTYYYTWVSCPLSCDFSNFSYIAVPRTSVDEKYVFGN